MYRSYLIIVIFSGLLLFSIKNMAQSHMEIEALAEDGDLNSFYANPDKYTEEQIIYIFQKKANTYMFTFPDSVIHYYRLLSEYGEKVNSPFITAVGLKSEAQFQKMRGNNRKAIELHKQAISLLDKNHQFTGTSYLALGSIYLWLDVNETNREGLLDSADIFIHEGLRIDLNNKDTSLYSASYQSLGNLYFRQKRYHSAIEAFIKALEYHDQANSPLIAVVTHDYLSQTYRLLDDLENSNIQLYKGLAIAKKEGYERSIAQLKGELGRNQLSADSFEQAIIYLEEAIVYQEANEQYDILINSYSNLALCYINLGQLDKARELLDKAKNAKKDKPENENNLSYHFASGKYHLALKEYAAAEIIFRKMASIASQIDLTSYKIKALQALGTIYKSQNRYAEALAVKDTIIALDRMNYADAQKNVIYDYANKYEAEKKAQEILRLNNDKEIQSQELVKRRKQLALSLLSLLFALLGIAGVIYALKIRNRSNKQLSKNNQELTNTLEERELLLKEIHHRVKNNLQVISGLLKWQSSFIKDEKTLSVFNEGQNRVQSMAIIHQKLYQSDNLMGIEMNDYILRLSQSLVSSYNLSDDQIDLSLNIGNLILDVDTVIPLGLILNELISNALKHAFPNNSSGEIVIKLLEDSAKNELFLEVRDNGIGMGEMESQRLRDSFGMELVETLSKKLKADLSVTHDQGTVVQLKIKNFKLAG